jgi:excisionase family DNA binding protein
MSSTKVLKLCKEKDSHIGRDGGVQEWRVTVEANAWMTTTEAARHLRIKPRTLAQWVRSGKIPGHKLSGNQRVT